MNIHKGDTIQIRVGKDRKKTGKVLRVDIKKETILVEGINLFKKHNKPKREGEKGETVTLPRPIAVGKANLYCSKCKKGVRVGSRVDGKKKVRYCKRCEATL